MSDTLEDRFVALIKTVHAVHFWLAAEIALTHDARMRGEATDPQALEHVVLGCLESLEAALVLAGSQLAPSVLAATEELRAAARKKVR